MPLRTSDCVKRHVTLTLNLVRELGTGGNIPAEDPQSQPATRPLVRWNMAEFQDVKDGVDQSSGACKRGGVVSRGALPCCRNSVNTGALIISIGFWCLLYYHYDKDEGTPIIVLLTIKAPIVPGLAKGLEP